MRSMMLAVVLLLAAGSVRAGAAEYQRGEFRFSVGPLPGYVVPHQVPEAWDPAAPGAKEARWRYWLYDNQSDRRSGRDEVYVDHVFEPMSPTMLGEAGRFQISFNPGYQSLVIHQVKLRRAGEWLDRLVPDKISLARRESGFEQDMTDGQVTAMIVLDDVRLNDVVRITYSVKGSNPILAGQVTDWAATGWRSPVLDTYLRVLHDPGARIAIHRENDAPAPQVAETSQAVEVASHVHGAAAVVDEDNYPAWYQPFPQLQIGAAREWGDVVAWALPLYPATDALPDDLEKRVAGWNQVVDPYERLTGALRTVQDDIRYFGVEMGDNTHRPATPGTTWQRRYGDCKDKAYLLATLLGRLKIDAVPALVSSRRGRALQDFVPSASDFDHVIVRALIGGKTLWVDPTMSQQGGDPRDGDLTPYGVALPIVAGNKQLEPVTAARQGNAGFNVVEHFTPIGDGATLHLDIESVYRGYMADSARHSLANQRPEDLSRRYSDFYRKRYGELDATRVPKLEDDRKANVLTISESYDLAAPFEDQAGLRALQVYGDALDSASALPPTMSRKGPLQIGLPANFRQEIRVDIPKRWSPTFGNESSSYASPAFDYTRKVEVGDDSIQLMYDMDVKQPDIGPAKVPGHLAELRKVRDDLSAQLRFKLPADLGRQERDERLKTLLRDVIDGKDP